MSTLLLLAALAVAGWMSTRSRRVRTRLSGSGSLDRRTRALRAAVGWDAGALAVLVAGGVVYGLTAV